MQVHVAIKELIGLFRNMNDTKRAIINPKELLVSSVSYPIGLENSLKIKQLSRYPFNVYDVAKSIPREDPPTGAKEIFVVSDPCENDPNGKPNFFPRII